MTESTPSPEPHPEPRWQLPEEAGAGWLRRRAKLLKRAYADPGHPRHDEALEAVAAYDPPGGGSVPLERAQEVLARGLGFADWSTLIERRP